MCLSTTNVRECDNEMSDSQITGPQIHLYTRDASRILTILLLDDSQKELVASGQTGVLINDLAKHAKHSQDAYFRSLKGLQIRVEQNLQRYGLDGRVAEDPPLITEYMVARREFELQLSLLERYLSYGWTQLPSIIRQRILRLDTVRTYSVQRKN